MTGTAALASVPPAVPAPLSMFNPVPVGIDEFGHRIGVRVIYKNVLAAGEPGGGKSALLQIIAAHAALSARSRLVLFDGKLVELGLLKSVADEFVGPDIHHAIITLRRLQLVMNRRYAWLEACGRRKIEPADAITTITAIFDEIALYSTVLGTEQQQKQFVTLLRDLVARGRAAAIIVIAATQRPWSTSSRKACATCSATAPRSAAPPTGPATSSSATAGPARAFPLSASRLLTRASPCSSPKAAPPSGSRPTTSPTTTSKTWWPTPPGRETHPPPL